MLATCSIMHVLNFIMHWHFSFPKDDFSQRATTRARRQRLKLDNESMKELFLVNEEVEKASADVVEQLQKEVMQGRIPNLPPSPENAFPGLNMNVSVVKKSPHFLVFATLVTH